MLIATITLLTVLLLGGASDFYFIESLDQSVKKEVLDKSRKKEVQTILSDYRKSAKKYNKARASHLKQLDELLKSQYSTYTDFFDLHDTMDSLTKHQQSYALETRLLVSELLTDEEWDKVVMREKQRMLKAYDKSVKKESKVRADKYFSRMEVFIVDSDIPDLEKMSAKKNLEWLKQDFCQLSNFHSDTQLEFNQIILDKHSSEGDYGEIIAKQEDLRNDSYNSLIRMHESMSNNLSEKEWQKLVKHIRKSA